MKLRLEKIIVAFGLASCLGASSALADQNTPVFLICSWPAENNGKIGINAQTDVTFKICQGCSSMYGYTWDVSDTAYTTQFAPTIFITINRFDGSFLYDFNTNVVPTSNNGEVVSNGSCTKVDKPAL